MIIAEIEKGNATLLKTRRRTVTSKEAKFLSLLSVYSSTRLELALDQASLLPNQANHCKEKIGMLCIRVSTAVDIITFAIRI